MEAKKSLAPEEREELIQGAIWTFGIEGIELTREEAEEALERSLTMPPLEL